MPQARWLALYPFLLVSAGKKRNELHGWGEIRIINYKESRVYILVIVHYKVNYILKATPDLVSLYVVQR